MSSGKKVLVTLNVVLATFLTMVASNAAASNQIMINQAIEVTTPILPDRTDTGYQYFYRFAELGNGPQCNLHIVSPSEAIIIPAGTVLKAPKGIVVNPKTSKHPLDFSSDISVRIDAVTDQGATFTIQCSDSKSVLSWKSLKQFNVTEINEFTLPYIEIK